MSFINTPEQLAECLTELLETPVSPDLIKRLSDKQQRYIIFLKDKIENYPKIKEIIMSVKPKRHYDNPRVNAYLKMKFKEKPLDRFYNYDIIEELGSIEKYGRI